VGDDPRFRADATKALVAELLGADDASLALEEFTLPARADAGEGDASAGDGASLVDRALSSASTPPFGTERRVIVIREAGAMSAADADAVAR
jgi:hypothetical protein